MNLIRFRRFLWFGDWQRPGFCKRRVCRRYKASSA